MLIRKVTAMAIGRIYTHGFMQTYVIESSYQEMEIFDESNMSAVLIDLNNFLGQCHGINTEILPEFLTGCDDENILDAMKSKVGQEVIVNSIKVLVEGVELNAAMAGGRRWYLEMKKKRKNSF